MTSNDIIELTALKNGSTSLLVLHMRWSISTVDGHTLVMIAMTTALQSPSCSYKQCKIQCYIQNMLYLYNSEDKWNYIANGL